MNELKRISDTRNIPADLVIAYDKKSLISSQKPVDSICDYELEGYTF